MTRRSFAQLLLAPIAAPVACAKEVDGLLCRTARKTLDVYRAPGRVGCKQGGGCHA